MHRTQKIAEIQRLIKESSIARRILAEDMVALQHRFNAPARLRHSLTTHPFPWLGGTATLGLLTSRLFRRKPKPPPEQSHDLSAVKQGGIFLTLLGLAFTTLRPMAQVWATDRLKHYLGNRMRYRSTRGPQGSNFRPSNPL